MRDSVAAAGRAGLAVLWLPRSAGGREGAAGHAVPVMGRRRVPPGVAFPRRLAYMRGISHAGMKL
jgi:hypothetical protein